MPRRDPLSWLEPSASKLAPSLTEQGWMMVRTFFADSIDRGFSSILCTAGRFVRLLCKGA